MRNFEDIDYYLNGWQIPIKCVFKKKKEPVNVCIYKTLRYPPKSKQPKPNFKILNESN